MNMLMIIAIALVCVFSSVEARLAKPGHHGGGDAFCDKPDPGAVLEKVDACIVNATIKETWLDCRDNVTGSRDPEEAAKAYCADTKKERKDMSRKFRTCIKTSDVSWREVMEEIDENCGFCKNKDILVKLDGCIAEEKVRGAWFECRQDIYHTVDPVKAADEYCDADKSEQHSLRVKALICLKKNGVNKRNWKKATKTCKWGKDDDSKKEEDDDQDDDDKKQEDKADRDDDQEDEDDVKKEKAVNSIDSK